MVHLYFYRKKMCLYMSLKKIWLLCEADEATLGFMSGSTGWVSSTVWLRNQEDCVKKLLYWNGACMRLQFTVAFWLWWALPSLSLTSVHYKSLQITTCCRPLSSSYSTAKEHFITLSPVIILRPAWPSRSIKHMTLKQRKREGWGSQGRGAGGREGVA